MSISRRVVCLNCMDGRIQIPVIDWIKNNYPVDHVDMVTEPGMDGLVSNESYPLDGLIRKINISISSNHAFMIFVVGHHDCRGNPVPDTTHREQIQSAVKRIQAEFRQIQVTGIWVNSKWQGEKV